MSAPLIVVTGTGTGIGKTHVAEALVRAWARLLITEGRDSTGAAGLKPIETGVIAGAPSDRETLEQASTFHVKRFPPPYMLRRAVSPHLAAIEEGVTIEPAIVVRHVEEVRQVADGVVVELPGGLFSPLARGVTNADVTRLLHPNATLLIASDRLGVLHDVAAATRAASAEGVSVTAIVLVAPEHSDASTGTNARELSVVTNVFVGAIVPRESVSATSERAELTALIRAAIMACVPAR